MLLEFSSLDLPGLCLSFRPWLVEAGQVSAGARALETDVLIMDV